MDYYSNSVKSFNFRIVQSILKIKMILLEILHKFKLIKIVYNIIMNFKSRQKIKIFYIKIIQNYNYFTIMNFQNLIHVKH